MSRAENSQLSAFLEKGTGSHSLLNHAAEHKLTVLMIRRAIMVQHRVQYGVVSSANAEVPSAAPGFRAKWHSKADLKAQVLSRKNVPQDAELYFWDGELWLEWEDDTALPGPALDPLRVKVVYSQPAGKCLFTFGK